MIDFSAVYRVRHSRDEDDSERCRPQRVSDMEDIGDQIRGSGVGTWKRPAIWKRGVALEAQLEGTERHGVLVGAFCTYSEHVGQIAQQVGGIVSRHL